MNELGVRGGRREGGGRKGSPGARIGALKSGERVTGWGIPERPSRWEREGGKVQVGATSLSDPSSAGTGDEGVARLSAVCAEASIRPTAALLHGERAMTTASAIHFHGDRMGGIGVRLAGRGRGQSREFGGKKGETGGLRGWLGARKGCSRLILFDGDGCCQVGMKNIRDGTPSRELKTNGFSQFFGKRVDEGVVSPARGEGGSNVLKSNSQF